MRRSIPARMLAGAGAFLLVVGFITVRPSASLASVTVDEQAVAERFEEVARLRFNGKYDQAIAELRNIIEEFSAADNVIRRAYHDLVNTYRDSDDLAGAREAAREGLRRFPDLRADDPAWPPAINELYDELRAQMFGSLTVRQPKDARVFLDDKHVGDIGEAPLVLSYVPVGAHKLTVTKSGHEDKEEEIHITADRDLVVDVDLKRRRDWKWWTWRAGAVVVGGVLLAIGLSGGDENPPPPVNPLPDPPAPPAN